MATKQRLFRDPALGFILLAAGLALMAVVSHLEALERRDLPWAEALWALDGSSPWTGTLAVAAKRIPLENFPDTAAMVEQLRAAVGDARVESFGLERTEWLVAVAAGPAILEPILADGRLPEPDSREVLAGTFTRLDTFEAGGDQYTVVGRVKQGVGSLYFSYVTATSKPLEWEYPAAEGWSQGWLDPDGLSKLRADPDLFELLEDTRVIGGLAPANTSHAWGIGIGLVLVVVGGAIVQVRMLQVMAGRRTGPFGPFLHALQTAPGRLFLAHGILYPVFLGAIVAGFHFPVTNMRLQEYVARMFSEGDLAYVGEAYLSANIPWAAFTTFVNNYLVQTLAMTLLVSFIIPLAGLVKNLMSFGLAGFVLAPLWADVSGRFLYHSITITLELEAYVLASFAVIMLASKMVEGLRQGRFVECYMEGAVICGGAALVSGVMLAVAAVYEATTLILLA